MQSIIGVLLIIGLLAFTGYEVYAVISTIRDKKKSKIQDKEDVSK